MSGGGAEREGDTESEAGSGLQAVSTGPDVGLERPNREIMTSDTQPSHPGTPIFLNSNQTCKSSNPRHRFIWIPK